MTSARVSVLMLYRRIFSLANHLFRAAWWICLPVVLIYGAILFAIFVAQCSPDPISALWLNPGKYYQLGGHGGPMDRPYNKNKDNRVTIAVVLRSGTSSSLAGMYWHFARGLILHSGWQQSSTSPTRLLDCFKESTPNDMQRVENNRYRRSIGAV